MEDKKFKFLLTDKEVIRELITAMMEKGVAYNFGGNAEIVANFAKCLDSMVSTAESISVLSNVIKAFESFNRDTIMITDYRTIFNNRSRNYNAIAAIEITYSIIDKNIDTENLDETELSLIPRRIEISDKDPSMFKPKDQIHTSSFFGFDLKINKEA